MKHRFSPQAIQDLFAISDYIALDNVRAANRVVNHIEKTCVAISETPGIGKVPQFLDEPDVLYLPVNRFKRYLIFYRVSGATVEILRIVHGARHLPNAYYNKD